MSVDQLFMKSFDNGLNIHPIYIIHYQEYSVNSYYGSRVDGIRCEYTVVLLLCSQPWGNKIVAIYIRSGHWQEVN